MRSGQLAGALAITIAACGGKVTPRPEAPADDGVFVDKAGLDGFNRKLDDFLETHAGH